MENNMQMLLQFTTEKRKMKYKYFYNLQLQNEKKEWKCLQTQNQNIYKRQKFISNYKTQWIYDCIFWYVYAEQTNNRLIFIVSLFTNASTIYNWKTKNEIQILLQCTTEKRKKKCNCFYNL